jgi:hypothetical protein
LPETESTLLQLQQFEEESSDAQLPNTLGWVHFEETKEILAVTKCEDQALCHSPRSGEDLFDY